MPRAKPILPKDQEFLDDHFGIAPQWKSFQKKLKNPQFIDAVRQDTRSDRKLKRFSKMVGMRQQSKQKGIKVFGDRSNSYQIKYHPEAKRFSCSCPDWTYKRSVRNRGRTGECKHIRRVKNTMKQELMKTGSASMGLNLLRLGRGVHDQDKMRDQILKEKIKHKAYKRHMPRQGLISAYLGLKKSAAVRGLAAKSLQGQFSKLRLHPRI